MCVGLIVCSYLAVFASCGGLNLPKPHASTDNAILRSSARSGGAPIWQGLAFSPDSQLLAAGGNIWSVADRQIVGQYSGSVAFDSGSVAFSPDSTVLARATRGGVQLLSVTDQTEIVSFSADRYALRCMAFSPDGQWIAAGTFRASIVLWPTRLPDKKVIHTLEGHIGDIYTLAFSPDGQRLASGGQDGTIKLWSIPEVALVATLRGHRNVVLDVSFSSDGSLLASGSWDSTVKIWSLAEMKAIATLRGHIQGVSSVSFSPDGSLLASGEKFTDMIPWARGAGNGIKVWSVAKRRVVATLDGMRPVAFSPDGRWLVGQVKEGLRLWKASDITK